MTAKGSEIKQEMDKVKAAALGEVILYTGNPTKYGDNSNCMFHSRVHIGERLAFSGGLNIYAGISDTQSLITDEGCIETTLIPNHNVELALVEIEGIYYPLVSASNVPPVRVVTQMCLHEGGKAYVGPEEISRVLRAEGKGLFDNFFEQYVKQHWIIGN